MTVRSEGALDMARRWKIERFESYPSCSNSMPLMVTSKQLSR